MTDQTDLTELALADDRPAWSGKPVECATCRSAGVPVMAEDGWRMPVHRWWDSATALTCPGSLAAVTAPQVPASMEARIEDHFVRAMPPEHQDIPEGKGLTATADGTLEP